MATSDKLTENYLTCIICAEVFTNPTTLHCDHTFCRPCLVKYIKTQPDALQAKSIPCPSCRQMTRVASPERPVEDWVNQVKPSRLIQGLMEDFVPGNDSKDPNTCDVCRKEGETTQAKSWCMECEESLCDNCLKMHRRFAATSVHEVTPLVGEIMQRRTSRFMCNEHTDEQVKLFCKDCKKAICHICCSISHRQCISVVTLETVMTEATDTLEKKRYDLEKKIKGDLQQLANQKERMDEVTRNACMVESEIKQTSQKIQDEVLKKESKLLDDLAKLRDKQKEELAAGVKSKEISLQGHRQEYEFIDLALKSESPKDIFAIYGSWMESIDDTDKEDDISAKGRIRYTQDKDQLKKAIGNIQLGEVDVVKDAKYQQDILQPEMAIIKLSKGKDVNSKTSSIVLHEVIDCKMEVDKSNPKVFDVVVLTANDGKIIVAADDSNRSIKAFYRLKTKSYAKVEKLTISQWQIAKLAENEIAISGYKKIAFVKFNPDPVVTAVVNSVRRYYGLSCLSSIELAGGADGSVDILSKDGKASKSISKLIKYPYYIHFTQGADLLVSDRNDKSVVSMTMDGQINFTYKPERDRSLIEPRGITTTGNGDILFADKGSNKVIQLTESGQFVRELLTKQDDLDNPRGLYLDEDGLLYVASTR